MVSIMIPSRGEKFLQKTVEGILANATGKFEVIVGLDGYYPDFIKESSNVKICHQNNSIGMRNLITKMIGVAQGEFIMKLDAHCILDKGFDEVLSSDCEDNWICIPRQYSLHSDTWSRDINKRFVDYWYLCVPNTAPEEELGTHNRGLVGKRWFGRQGPDIDDLMSFQGSLWFATRKHVDSIGVTDPSCAHNFAYEGVELGMKTWLSGGRVVVNKKTWYAHLFKGRKHGRGYVLSKDSIVSAAKFCIDMTMNNKWPNSIHDIKWFIDKFSPVPSWENFDWDRKWGSNVQSKEQIEALRKG